MISKVKNRSTIRLQNTCGMAQDKATQRRYISKLIKALCLLMRIKECGATGSILLKMPITLVKIGTVTLSQIKKLRLLC